MPEILEVEQTETDEIEMTEPKWDSWTVEIPAEIIEAQGWEKGSLATFTVREGKIVGEIVPPLSNKLREISKRILEKNREVYEELKRLGD